MTYQRTNTEWRAGFRQDVAPTPTDSYSSIHWFEYMGKDGFHVFELFPPIGREDTYGGKTETELRTMAFERLNSLERTCEWVNLHPAHPRPF